MANGAAFDGTERRRMRGLDGPSRAPRAAPTPATSTHMDMAANDSGERALVFVGRSTERNVSKRNDPRWSL